MPYVSVVCFVGQGCLCENNRSDVKNCVIGLGKCITRLPTENELAALVNAGYAPLNMTCYNKMTLNGVRYECINEEKTKFCNSTVFGGNEIFGNITTKVNFHHNNEAISGIIIQRMRLVNRAFETEYINEETISDEIIFIKESEFIKPATQILTSSQLYVIKQTNCWETD
ncbi:hypothetical protein KQX54_001944 [Cotesia glomerata]|uniref:Uncharacterized protein n=1 Tax=Cotesia glomerata TaxID=32391 RepID=A0AAV7IAJ4_COTGL|nr:hypothetical protein KQX54_001944 [Cotesia glomerata]